VVEGFPSYWGQTMKPRIVIKDGIWHCSGAILLGCFPWERLCHGDGYGLSVRAAYMDWANSLVIA
jgi:hypothetical protein